MRPVHVARLYAIARILDSAARPIRVTADELVVEARGIHDPNAACSLLGEASNLRAIADTLESMADQLRP